MIKTHRFKIDKLIRDKVSDFMRDKNIIVSDRKIVQHKEYLERLNNKLVEEAKEVIEAQNTQNLIEELADVLEVLNTIASTKGIAFQEIEDVRLKKRAKKGGFEDGIYCEFIEISSDNKEIDYCLAKPAEYPEIKF